MVVGVWVLLGNDCFPNIDWYGGGLLKLFIVFLLDSEEFFVSIRVIRG